MSYRPTISVYINDRIVDCGYYQNWYDKDLFYEAVAIAAFFGNCSSREEYYDRMFCTQKVFHVLEPEVFEATEENLRWFEEASEFPVIVDLTEKCIYTNFGGALSGSELKKSGKLPTQRISAASPDEVFTAVLKCCKISFRHWDMEAIRNIISEWKEAKHHLSTNLLNRITAAGTSI